MAPPPGRRRAVVRTSRLRDLPGRRSLDEALALLAERVEGTLKESARRAILSPATCTNQRSLTLNLKHPEGLAVARRLAGRADVLVQNFRPGVMGRLGLEYETPAQANPRLISVSASGYGESSPSRDRPGQDLSLQALSGLASLSGRAGQPPTPIGTAAVDQHGAVLLALGVLAALAPYAAAGYNFPAREEVARILEPVLRTRTTAEWMEHLVPRGIWAAPVLEYAETFADPAVQAADAVQEISHPVAGHVRLLRFPLEFSTGRAAVRRPPPLPGEHTEEILRDLGYAEGEIRRLRDQRVV